jgi:hypothetical protein
MAQAAAQKPIKTLRGTWEEILAHRDEIPRSSVVEVKVYALPPGSEKETPTMKLMRSWLEEDATDDPEEIKIAEEELREFKRNMNAPRKESGARLLYPEEECV